MTARFVHVVATDCYSAIGKGGRLPWNEPTDMAFFRIITMGQTLVVGRKTYQDLVRRHEKKYLERVSPLKGRKLIVLTTDPEFRTNYSDVVVITDIAKLLTHHPNETLYVIGGQQIYDLLAPSVSIVSVVKSIADNPDAFYRHDYMPRSSAIGIKPKRGNPVKVYVHTPVPNSPIQNEYVDYVQIAALAVERYLNGWE